MLFLLFSLGEGLIGVVLKLRKMEKTSLVEMSPLDGQLNYHSKLTFFNGKKQAPVKEHPS